MELSLHHKRTVVFLFTALAVSFLLFTIPNTSFSLEETVTHTDTAYTDTAEYSHSSHTEIPESHIFCPACTKEHTHHLKYGIYCEHCELCVKSGLAPPAKDENHIHVEDKYGFHTASDRMARELSLWSGLPFIGILLSIALFPLIAPHFWHRHYNKVSIAWALIFAVPFIITYKGLAIYQILHIYLIDYVPFMILLWGLYTASGGILLRGALVGTPWLNIRLLFIGVVLASFMGTTGASMLMIRPILRANKYREHKTHVIIFFILLVSNVGGSLTPLGDPPLFLGFLHGVPFTWTMNLLPHFSVMTLILLGLFYILDKYYYLHEQPQASEKDLENHENWPLRIEGVHNFMCLIAIGILVMISGMWRPGYFTVYGVNLEIQNLVRDVGIIVMALLSLESTHIKIRQDNMWSTVRQANEFSWFPIKEVAWLFMGIFMCIIPMLAMLKAGTEGAMAFIVDQVKEPYHYFWITGILSSFLDNAPTYLTFFNLSMGSVGINEAEVGAVLGSMSHAASGQFTLFLKGISAGAVFFGGMTYIGNAPNFMVKAIAEENGVKMPSFFGYMIWSFAILIPLFIVVTLLFFG